MSVALLKRTCRLQLRGQSRHWRSRAAPCSHFHHTAELDVWNRHAFNSACGDRGSQCGFADDQLGQRLSGKSATGCPGTPVSLRMMVLGLRGLRARHPLSGDGARLVNAGIAAPKGGPVCSTDVSFVDNPAAMLCALSNTGVRASDRSNRERGAAPDRCSIRG